MDTAIKQGTRKGRPNYSMEFRRRLAVAACAPNVSVSKLGLAHEVNANMVFKWRRQYRAGLFGADPESAFLPVAGEQLVRWRCGPERCCRERAARVLRKSIGIYR